MKRTIRLTESELHNIIKESVNQIIIREGFGDNVRGAIKGWKQGEESMLNTAEVTRDAHKSIKMECEMGINSIDKCLQTQKQPNLKFLRDCFETILNSINNF